MSPKYEWFGLVTLKYGLSSFHCRSIASLGGRMGSFAGRRLGSETPFRQPMLSYLRAGPFERWRLDARKKKPRCQ
jgi:hypothetical protein